MGKLYELLAVIGELQEKAGKARKTTIDLFTGGKGRLVGQVRRYTPLDDAGERLADESSELAASVYDELRTFSMAFGPYLDAEIQKEATNQVTSASIEIDGVAFISDLPATALLNLESKLADIRAVYADIPTLDPAEHWEYDSGLGCHVSRDRVTYRTKKTPKAFVAYEATKEHPAQVQMFTEDVQVGSWMTRIFSGMITVEEKKAMLDRLDNLIVETKKARQRANGEEVTKCNVAAQIFGYINSGTGSASR